MTEVDGARTGRVGIVTVSYGSEAVLGAFLESLPAASAHPMTVVIADNKPEPGGPVQELAEKHGAIWLPMDDNVGYGGGMNAGVERLPADTEWVLVSNPDVALAPGSIDSLLETADEDPAIGAIGPAVYNSDGTLYPSARAVPSLRTGVGHAMFFNLWPGNPWSRRYRNDWDGAQSRRDAGWLSGSCQLVRKSAFDEVGGFDPDYFMYFEDVDLGYRLGKAGYRNVYQPGASVTHTGAHSTTTESARMISVHHDSARTFLNKKYSGPLMWPVRVTLTMGLSLRSALIRRRLNKQGD
ncbi:glycosyltransferase family 2 protein [Cryobacterium sp. BB307]|uniref:glycosyltransferase family 2 protein n=1 Tax=Cryobacterium sp. BB307 TaxID=2716317 RepID=UPI001B2FF2AA|nr:glycosyltransferase family 2 protein [Cryobacterium sp. BB307]